MTINTDSNPVSGNTADQSDRIGGTMQLIQCLRFVAATVVVIFHAYVTFVPPISADQMLETPNYWFGFGRVGVHIFFVISGYIMYLTSSRILRVAGLTRFLVRRFVRIYPVYWIYVTIYLAGTAAIGTMPLLAWDKFIGMLVLSPGSAPMVIGPAWTLSFEVYFYLTFGVAMLLGAARGTIVLTGFFVASIIVGAIIRPDQSVVRLVTDTLLLEFLMGVWIARLTLVYVFPLALGWLAIAMASGGYVLGLACGYESLPSAIMWGLPSALLVAGAVVIEQRGAVAPGGLPQRLSWLGDSSYSLYLCHVLIATLVIKALREAGVVVPLFLLLAITTIGCIWFAAVFYALVERPLIAALQRILLGSAGRKVPHVRLSG